MTRPLIKWGLDYNFFNIGAPEKSSLVVFLRSSGFKSNPESVRMAVRRFYDLTVKLLSGETFSLSALKGKVVLIENVASLWGTTTRDYTQMNELHSRYSDKGLVILGVPCNQFGHQVGHEFKSGLQRPVFPWQEIIYIVYKIGTVLFIIVSTAQKVFLLFNQTNEK